MPKFASDTLTRIKTTAGAFSLPQRTIAIIGLAGVVLGLVVFVNYLAKPSMTPLFTGLAAEDASAIVDQLQAADVEYELTDGGATILVPQAKVYEQRLAAAANGLPTSANGGYALLDNVDVTSSDFQQSVTYKRAIEGELENTISAMKGIKTASVQLAIPEETVFAQQKVAPTASVFVETQAGASLSTEQVNAITHLTSASIEGMTSENVAVIDSNGVVLSAVGQGTKGGVDSQRGDYEERTQKAVQSMLDRIVGAGNSTVAVSVTVSSESAEITSETFTAPEEGTPPLSESIQREQYDGTSGQGGAGVLGPDNIAVPGGTNGEGTYVSESEVRNNSVNKVTENRSVPAGAIAKQTVSVALDETAAKKVTETEVEALVAAAAGIDEDRGDSVAVKFVAFSDSGHTDAKEALERKRQAEESAQFWDTVRMGFIAAAIAIPAIIFTILFLRRGKVRTKELDVSELTETETPQSATPEPAVAAAEVVEDVAEVQPSGPSIDQRRSDISRLAAADPERAADLIRGIMDGRASR